MSCYILFYSQYCAYCGKFLNLLSQLPDYNYFKLIPLDVATIGSKKKAFYIQNYNLDVVPTIIIDNNKLEGNNAFNWLNERINDLQHKVSSLSTRTQIKDPMRQEEYRGDNRNGISNQQELQGINIFGDQFEPNIGEMVELKENRPVIDTTEQMGSLEQLRDLQDKNLNPFLNGTGNARDTEGQLLQLPSIKIEKGRSRQNEKMSALLVENMQNERKKLDKSLSSVKRF